MEFKILKKSKSSRARLGLIKTRHGVIHTPAFVPVGTKATVKGITPEQLKAIGADSVLCNTYHLYLRPGDQLVKKMGGLHKFMNWNRPIWTDSGGFQVFSLGAAIQHGVGKVADLDGASALPMKSGKSFVKITDDGVEFRSHLDGSQHFFTPEKSINIQENLGADIIFAFDECTSPKHDHEYTKKSLERTHSWARRCLKAFKGNKQALFGIVQGGIYKDLRIESAKVIGAMDFDGFGIGGAFGEKEMNQVLDWTIPLLPENKPKHLLGIGSEKDIWNAVKRGIDTFDCVVPTRLGRAGSALIRGNKLFNVKSGRYSEDKKPIDKNCGCYTCVNYSRAYLTHLFHANEMLGPILTTIHNLWFMENLMKGIRQRIAKED